MTAAPAATPTIRRGYVNIVQPLECRRPGQRSSPSAQLGLSPQDALRQIAEIGLQRQQQAVANLLPELRATVETQPWVGQYHPSAMLVLDYILQFERCRMAMALAQPQGQYRTVADILGVLSTKAWYQDGLSNEDYATVSDLFSVYFAMAGVHMGSPALVHEPGTLLVTAIERDVAQGIRMPRGGRRSLMVFTDSALTARVIYQQAIDVLPRMESFASSLQPAGIVFLQVPTDAVCGQTPSRIAPGVVQLILIGRGCLTPRTIYTR
jgi:hypothetical protein